jgi:hypothetical protein
MEEARLRDSKRARPAWLGAKVQGTKEERTQRLGGEQSFFESKVVPFQVSKAWKLCHLCVLGRVELRLAGLWGNPASNMLETITARCKWSRLLRRLPWPGLN